MAERRFLVPDVEGSSPSPRAMQKTQQRSMGWFIRNAYEYQHRKDLAFISWLNVNDPEESTLWVNSSP